MQTERDRVYRKALALWIAGGIGLLLLYLLIYNILNSLNFNW